jgi:hypothetical protein
MKKEYISSDNIILTFDDREFGEREITLSDLLDGGIPIDEDGDDLEFVGVSVKN